MAVPSFSAQFGVYITGADWLYRLPRELNSMSTCQWWDQIRTTHHLRNGIAFLYTFEVIWLQLEAFFSHFFVRIGSFTFGKSVGLSDERISWNGNERISEYIHMTHYVPNEYPNILGWNTFTKQISEYIRSPEIAQIRIRIIFKGHFIRIFEYLYSSLIEGIF